MCQSPNQLCPVSDTRALGGIEQEKLQLAPHERAVAQCHSLTAREVRPSPEGSEGGKWEKMNQSPERGED